MVSVPTTSSPAVSDPVATSGFGPAGASPTSSPLYDAEVGSALTSLIGQYGVVLLGQKGRLRGLLQDECPRAKREISVLLQALDEHVPQDLLRVQSGEPIRSLAPRLTRRLVEEKAMSAQASRWAVDTWAQGLGIAPLAAADGAAAAGSDAAAPVPALDDEWLEPDPPLVVPAPVPQPGPIPKPVPAWLKPTLAAAAALLVVAGGWMAFAKQKLEIASVDVSAPLVSNGKPLPVQVAYRSHNAAPKQVEVRFVRGDGNWGNTPTLIALSGAAEDANDVRVPAGSFSFRAAKPSSVTFSYTLVTEKGFRSEPFERTFNLAPPVAINEIVVPRNLQVGRAFDITFKYTKGASDIVKIERRVIQSTGNWGEAEKTMPVKYSSASGSFDFHYEAFVQAMNSTIEFTLIDAEGVRSEPYRIALNVAPAPVQQQPTPDPNLTPIPRPNPLVNPMRLSPMATVVSVREVRTPGQATGLGAVAAGVLGGLTGRQFGHGTGRDVMTGLGAAGGAVAGNEIERNLRASSSWETVVRMDSGETRTIQSASAPGWRSGDRVSVDGSRIVGRR